MVFSRFGLVWVYLAKVCSEKINLVELIVAMVKGFPIHPIYGQKCFGAIIGLGWDWVWDLCVELFHEHRFNTWKEKKRWFVYNIIYIKNREKKKFASLKRCLYLYLYFLVVQLC